GVSFWLLVAFILIAALLGRFAYLVKPFDHDARIFIYLGKLVCDGGRFYHDVLDNKFPSVGLMTSVCWRWLGTWWPGYVLLQTGLALGGALLLGRWAARYFGPHARLPACLFAIVYLNFNVAVFGGFQLETLQTFFAILAAGGALEALRGKNTADAFLAGLAAGCAAMLKPTGLSVLAAFALAVILHHRSEWRIIIRLGAAATGGLLLPLLVVFLYLLRTDILRDMPELYRQISRYAADTPWETTDYFKPFVVLTIALFPVFVRAWIFRRKENRIPGRLDQPGALFALTWMLLELLGAVMQKRMYAYHFLPVAAPATLLYAMWPRRDKPASLAAALVPLAFASIIASSEIMTFYWGTPMRSPVSDYLVARTAVNDAVWSDSVPRILLETGLKPGARIPLTFLFLNYDEAPLEYSDVMLRDFDSRRPKYIVMPMDLKDKLRDETARAPELFHRPLRRDNYIKAWNRIDTYVHEHYKFEKWLDGQIIYRRSDEPGVAHLDLNQ
ncbi:MAG TPA: hypothetical protein VF669_06530, partial [Tepidisphaeraceae bacterium]